MGAMLNDAELVRPTEEQAAIVEAWHGCDDNLLINALAGSGKTSTLEMLLDTIDGPALYLAFNKSIVKEAEERVPSTCKVQTLNSLGHRVWAQAVGTRLAVDTQKTYLILRDLIGQLKDKEDADELWDAFSDITHAVSMAKHMGYIPQGKFPHAKPITDRQGLETRLEDELSELSWWAVDNTLVASIKASYSGGIDFDDQIYMPALFGGTFPRFPNVLVDEDQDLSPSNIAMLKRLVSAAKSRLGAVGDRWQSIYYFRGAETNGVDKLKAMFNMKELPLSISFRCPSEIVRAVHWRVPHMRWIREGGRHATLQSLDSNEIPDGSAIICRNNAPLLRVAFGLLSERRSVQIAGTDIGPKVLRLLKKIGNEDDSRATLLAKIDAWLEHKLSTSRGGGGTHTDMAECLRIFASWGQTLNQAIGYAETIFKAQGAIQLTTGHKAKGREWETCYHLDPFLIRDDEQDQNLKYVITTRAKESMLEIETRNLQWL
jgi:DNA helicase II / ATP-dependent DNA helicase PcrA